MAGGRCCCLLRDRTPNRLARLAKPSSPPPPPAAVAQGALVHSASMADSRVLARSRSQVQAELSSEHRKLRGTLWELLVKNAPSARA